MRVPTSASKAKRAILRRLAACPTGVTVRDAAQAIGTKHQTAAQHLAAMFDAGDLVRVAEHYVGRFFVSRSAADAYVRDAAAAQAAQARKLPKGAHGRAWWPKDAEPRITSETKVTIAPTPAPSLRTNTHRGWL